MPQARIQTGRLWGYVEPSQEVILHNTQSIKPELCKAHVIYPMHAASASVLGLYYIYSTLRIGCMQNQSTRVLCMAETLENVWKKKRQPLAL